MAAAFHSRGGGMAVTAFGNFMDHDHAGDDGWNSPLPLFTGK